MPNDKKQYQYVKLPDGSYGKFRADAGDDVIRAAISKDFPDAFNANAPKFDPRQMNLPGGTPQLNLAAQLLHLPSAMPTKFEQDRDPANQPGLMGTLSNKLSAVGDKVQSFANQWEEESNAPQPQTKEEMWKRNEQFRDEANNVPANIAGAMKQQATRPLPSGLNNPVYRSATTLSPLVPFLNPEASEKASDVGDKGAVVAEAAVPAAAALIPAAGKYGYEKGVVGTRPLRATNAYQRGVLPETMKAADRTEAVSHFERSQPYLAAQERAMPVSKASDVWTDSADAADVAGQQLWQQAVEPAIHTYGNQTVHGAPVASRITSEFSPLDRTMRSASTEAADQLASYYNRPMTLQQVSDELTQLNNDKSIRSYYRMSDEARAAADLDPSSAPLRSKLAAQHGLRDLLFDSLGQRMGPEDAARFQEARRAFGSLKEVERRYSSASTPAPTNWLERGVNTIRAPKALGSYESWLRNPQRQAGRSMSLLGSSTLQTPELPQLTIPGAPPPQPRGLLDNPDAPGGFTPHVDVPFTQPGGTPISRQLTEGEPGWQWRGPASPVPGPQSGPGVTGYTAQGPEEPVPLQLPSPSGTQYQPGGPPPPVQPQYRTEGVARPNMNALRVDRNEPTPPQPDISQVGALPNLGHPVQTPDPMWTGEARPGIVPTRGPAAGDESGSMTTSGWPGVRTQGPTNIPNALWDRLPSSARESMFRPRPTAPTPTPAPTPPAPELSLPAGNPPAPSTSPYSLNDIPAQPINPQEVADLNEAMQASRDIPSTTPSGRPLAVGGAVRAEDVPDVLRRTNAARNVTEGLKGNRRDTAGETREAHREKLEPKGKDKRR